MRLVLNENKALDFFYENLSVAITLLQELKKSKPVVFPVKCTLKYANPTKYMCILVPAPF